MVFSTTFEKLRITRNTIKNWLIFSLITLSFLLKGMLAFGQADGQSIFKQSCASCHSTGANRLVGPGLRDISKTRTEAWLIDFIRDSQSMIAAGDKDAVAIFEEYNKIPMPAQNLSDEEIIAVMEFISQAEPAKASSPVAETSGSDLPIPPTGKPGATSFGDYMYLLIIAMSLFVIVIIHAIYTAQKTLRPEKPPGAYARFGKWFSSHKKFTTLLFILIIFGGLKMGWNALASIGITQGYQPTQPINFSHKVHAGINDIDCQYCHSSASKSKTAGIPSLSTCMNCHKFISEGTLTGTAEIAKIYTALDYDPNTMLYGSNPTPIEWVRVHNLPDHAYFNHSQHVNAAGLSCQTCHGDVQDMDVVKQHSKLTMGWC
ncbi:MAG: c-type cytochrome, partial [Bacteroidetes bacterium]|nr:c-type cytochrome [Bacteroidota bacterium]